MSDDPNETNHGERRYAHSLSDADRARWEELTPHLVRVAEIAARLAEKIGMSAAGRLEGLLHDIGKVSRAFQIYISGLGAPAGHGPDHSGAGAVIADTLFTDPVDRCFARLVAHAIAGHHAGLADAADLEERLGRGGLPDYADWRDWVPALPTSVRPDRALGWSGNTDGYRLAFLGRMLFSCLVDADFLATEGFYAEAEGRVVERSAHASLVELRDRLDAHLAQFANRKGALNARRAEILAHARAKAAAAPGLFTMTVPTGGGKTLASLAFALDHAVRHNLERVVYVIPYTSIIEQTADVFRAALRNAAGEAPDVLEHHGALDWDAAETPAQREALAKLRLASENWDIPVVVTTGVQFFESLHAARPSRCRKLHNLARSVVILDEAQVMPFNLLSPCLAALRELTAYGSSVVLCTATQPGLRRQDGFEHGLDIPDDRELAPAPRTLYAALRRVTVSHEGALDDAALAERLAAARQVLCIVNSRPHAQRVFQRISANGDARHLSTLMCPAHRRKVLADIRALLDAGEPVRVVSTSLIEAGVDIDFPEVWRAENGLAAIAQAAGRANREARLSTGRVSIFESIDGPAPAVFRKEIDAMRTALRLHGDDPLGLDAIACYFAELYGAGSAIERDRASLNGHPYRILDTLNGSWANNQPVPRPPYASVAAAFRMIDDPGCPVIVPWRGGEDPGLVDRLLDALRFASAPPGAALRRLQSFTVSVPEHVYRAMIGKAVQPVAPERYGDRFMLLENVGGYDEATGLSLDPYALSTDNAII